MDQLIALATRAFLFVYLAFVVTREEPKPQLFVNSFLIDLFTCPPGVDVSCRYEEPAVYNNLTSFLKAGGKIGSTCGIDSGSFNFNSTFLSNVRCNKTTSTVYSINDSCGGSSTCIHVISVKDQTAPLGFCPGITLHCEDPEPDTIRTYSEFINELHAATPTPGYVSDNCGLDTASFTLIKITKEFSGKCLTAIVQQYTIYDSCQNGIICSQRFTVLDDKYPSFIPARDTILLLDGSCFADTTLASLGGIQSPQDNCGIDSIYYIDKKIPGCIQTFASYQRIWRVVDYCKNATIDTQFIYILDTSRPTISGPRGIMVLCASDVPEADTNLIFATDNCSNLVIRFFVKDSVSDSTCANNKIINRIYSASDPCRNTAYFIQRIMVKDSLPPSLTCPDTLKVTCIALVPPQNSNMTSALDLCDGAMRIQIKDSSINQGCVNKQTIYRIFNAVDTCQNKARCVQVIVIDDNSPPSLTCPPDTLVSCFSSIPPVNPDRVVGVDNCFSTINISFQKDSAVNIICINKETIYRLYMGVDSCNNISRCRQVITVNDQAPPFITSFPNDTLVDCNFKTPTPNPALITASDHCGGIVQVRHLKDSIVGQSCVNNKKNYRIYIATDNCGNVLRRIQLITVFDHIPPVLTGPSNSKVLFCGASYTLVVPSGMDNCSAVLSVTTTSRVVDSTCIGNYKIIYSFV
ncbi:MAG: hypothetical protein ABIR66_00885, partial [Saprospiraceae bacterium]